MPPKVSVGIIAYNQAAFIRECVESVLSQDYPSLEVIVADDGSKDDTAAIVREIASHDARVQLIGGPNLGITGNCNRALHAVTGDLAVFMGGDDAMLPGRIARQVAAFEQNPGAAASVVTTEVFESSTGRVLRIQDVAPRGTTRIVSACEVVAGGNQLAAASSWMCRRSAFPAHGFDSRLPIASDALFFAEVARHGGVIAVGEVLSRYRVHNAQATRSGFGVDVHLYYAALEGRYPEMADCVRRGRALLAYEEATQSVLIGDLGRARARFQAASRYRTTPRTSVWRALLALPPVVRDPLIARWTKRARGE